MFVHKHSSGCRMGLVLTHKSVFLSLSFCFFSACQCPLWIKVKTSTEVIHILSFLLLCSAKSPGVLALLPFQTLFSVYSSLSRFPYCWQTELLHSGKCHIIQQRDALCRHAHTHAHIRVPAVLRHPFPLFFRLSLPLQCFHCWLCVFFCLILMFSDSED